MGVVVVGLLVGLSVGRAVGKAVVGFRVGFSVGREVGNFVGERVVGESVGNTVGNLVKGGNIGPAVGSLEGEGEGGKGPGAGVLDGLRVGVGVTGDRVKKVGAKVRSCICIVAIVNPHAKSPITTKNIRHSNTIGPVPQCLFLDSLNSSSKSCSLSSSSACLLCRSSIS